MMLAALVAAQANSARAASVRWYVTYQSLNEAGNSLNIGDAAQTVSLRGGWSCSIGPTSEQLPVYEARETTCENEAKRFQFSVQCEPYQKTDHTQIRFVDAQNRPIDFIEVGCEWSE